MVLGHQYDLLVDKKVDPNYIKRALQLNLDHPSNIKKRRLASLEKESNIDELALLDDSLPRVLGDKPFAEKFSSEVKQHHR
jgi:hypothetical protein